MILVFHNARGRCADLRLDVADTFPVPRIDELFTFESLPHQPGWDTLKHWIVLGVEHVWGTGVVTVKLHVEAYGAMPTRGVPR